MSSLNIASVWEQAVLQHAPEDLGGLNNALGSFPPVWKRETTFGISCLLFLTPVLFAKEVYTKWN